MTNFQIPLRWFVNISILFFLFSCGEQKKGSSKEKSFTPGEIKTNCTINGKNLEKFFEQEVPADIDCLGRSLKLFVRIVQPSAPEYAGYLSREILERYIKADPTLGSLVPNLKYFGLFFEVSNLIFGDSENKDYLNSIRIGDLTEFFKLINVHAIQMNILLKKGKKLHREALSESQRLEYFNLYTFKRKEIIEHTEAISNELLKLFAKGSKRYTNSVNLESILDTFGGNVAKYKPLLFVKRIFSSGDDKSVSQKELSYLIKVSPDLISLFYDISHFGEIVFASQNAQYGFYKQIVQNFKRLLYYSDSDPQDQNIVLFYMNQLNEGLRAIKIIQEDLDIDIEKIIPLIPELKQVLMMTDKDKLPGYEVESFTSKDFNTFISFLMNVLNEATDFAKLFQANKNIILSTKQLSKEDLVPSSEVSSSAYDNFVKIATKYRFFKGELRLPIFGDRYLRSESGIIELGIFEKAYDHIAKHYEREIPCFSKDLIRKRAEGRPDQPLNKCYGQKNGVEDEDYKGTLTQGQLEYVIYKLRDQLIDLNLVLGGREFVAAENATLLTSLFQFQSDADNLINAKEAVEFALQILASLNIKEDLLSGMKLFCKPMIDTTTKEEVYDRDCSRNAFVKILNLPFTRYINEKNKIVTVPSESYSPNSGDYILEDGLTYAKYIPRFAKFINPSNQDTKIKFVASMEKFTRSCFDVDEKNKVKRAYTDADLIGIFAGLFNIESTLVRFDTNNDNILTGNEVDATYQHFKKALDVIVSDLLGSKLIRKIYLEPIFYFLIKELKVPSLKDWKGIVSLIVYPLKMKKLKREAKVNQLTIASILSQIKSSSKNGMTDKEKANFCKIPTYSIP
ncbi:MAG: hypothetical protein QE271_09475 [Bacteriovoracaceae bacterium]|nr:hypothetical protein [Bacteriovoracaceae bacterium]